MRDTGPEGEVEMDMSYTCFGSTSRPEPRTEMRESEATVTQESQRVVATIVAETIITSSTVIEVQSWTFESLLVCSLTFESTIATIVSLEGLDNDFFEGVSEDMMCTPPHIEEDVV